MEEILIANIFNPNGREYKATVSLTLGELRQLGITSDLKEHYEYLISPINEMYIGKGACGLGGSIILAVEFMLL